MRIPGPKWGAGRPPLETPLPLVLKYLWRASAPWGCAIRIGRTPRRLRGWSFGAVGEGRERMRARHGRRTSTASFGGFAPWPPTFSKGKRSPVTRLFWGLRPLAPCVPRWGTFADHARTRMGRPKNQDKQATPSQICAEAPAAKRLGVPSLPSRELRAKHAPARPPGGTCRGEAPQPVFAYFLLARK